MTSEWCPICCTRHVKKADCPGELLATGEERHGWRVSVDTPHGPDACGVLPARAGDVWRAGILTYPNVLWTIPREQIALKGLVRWMNVRPHAGRSPGMGIQIEKPPARYKRSVRLLP